MDDKALEIGGIEMKVKLLAHTQAAEGIMSDLWFKSMDNGWEDEVTSGQVISLAAIRTCYSHKTPLEVIDTESEKYFGDKGKEGKRLFKQIVSSGHTSTLEHISFTFAIEGVSRSLLAQLTRHRHMSFSVQSQRYVKLSSESRSGGFDYVAPEKVLDSMNVYPNEAHEEVTALDVFEQAMEWAQMSYNALVKIGIPQEDARAVLPNAASCNLVLTANLRTLLDFYRKRKPGNGAQHEITLLAEKLKDLVIEVEPWTGEFFE